jgi:hypothetical protein
MSIGSKYFGAHQSVADDPIDVPEPGSEENPWIGAAIPGAKGKEGEGWSGAQRNRARRRMERAARKEQKVGQRAYNRERARRGKLAVVREAQLRVLKGELGTPAMQRNLENAVERLAKGARLTAEEKTFARHQAVGSRAERLYERRLERFRSGTQRGKDLLWEYVPAENPDDDVLVLRESL